MLTEVTLFTFPRKNPKSCTVSELKKTCTYLGIDTSNLMKKQQYVDIVEKRYNHIAIPTNRIEIKLDTGKSYWVNSYHRFKSFLKLESTTNTEIYILSLFRSRSSYKTIYNRLTDTWTTYTNFKSRKPEIITFLKETELNKWRNIRIYFNLQHLYIMGKYLVNHNVLHIDIFTHLITIHHQDSLLTPIVVTYL